MFVIGRVVVAVPDRVHVKRSRIISTLDVRSVLLSFDGVTLNTVQILVEEAGNNCPMKSRKSKSGMHTTYLLINLFLLLVDVMTLYLTCKIHTNMTPPKSMQIFKFTNTLDHLPYSFYSTWPYLWAPVAVGYLYHLLLGPFLLGLCAEGRATLSAERSLSTCKIFIF